MGQEVMLVDVIDLIEISERMADCRILATAGFPIISQQHRLPDDLRVFYENCGGLVLFEHTSFPTLFVPPKDLVLANPIIVGELAEDDISASWYIIASDGTDSQKITIDLDLERLGRCYDSFWDRHAIAGSSTIIARSFTEFFERSLNSGGDEFYWNRPNFASLGDAYDGMD